MSTQFKGHRLVVFQNVKPTQMSRRYYTDISKMGIRRETEAAQTHDISCLNRERQNSLSTNQEIEQTG